MRPVVEALLSLRSIDMIAAMTLLAEIGDFHRFARPRELMGFLGLVPRSTPVAPSAAKERSLRRGNSHARRVLVEAAWELPLPGPGEPSPASAPRRSTQSRA